MDMATIISWTGFILLITISQPGLSDLTGNTKTDDENKLCYTCSHDVTCSCCCESLQHPDTNHDVICGCSFNDVTHRLSCDVATRFCDVSNDVAPLLSCKNVTELIHKYLYCSYCQNLQYKHQQVVHASKKDILMNGHAAEEAIKSTSDNDSPLTNTINVTIKTSLVFKQAIDLDACLKYIEGKEGDLIQGFLNNLLKIFKKYNDGKDSQDQGQGASPNITISYTAFINNMDSCGNDLYCLDLRFPMGIQFHANLISDTIMVMFLSSHAKDLAYNFKNTISEDLQYFGIGVDSTDSALVLT